MDELLARIRQMDEPGFEGMLKEVLERYNDLFPGWELCAIPIRQNADRNQQIDRLIQTLESMKALPE